MGCTFSYKLVDIGVRGVRSVLVWGQFGFVFFREKNWRHSDIIKSWFCVGSGLLGVGSDTIIHWNLVEPVLNSGLVLIQDSVI